MKGVLAVLGGCGGIGRVLVAEAIAAGYDVRVLDLARSITAHPPSVPAIEVDATSQKDLQKAAEQLPSDMAGFVNLAGFMRENRTVTDVAPEIWEEVLTGNLTSSYLAIQVFSGKLAEGAAMVLTGSGLGHNVRPGFGPYAVSKAGIAALTRQCALELAPRLRVNCVAPSAVDTAFLRGGTGRSDENVPSSLDLQAYTNAIPMGRIAEPEDVTGPILFLLSDAARYITGQTIHVNGGTYMP